MDEAQAISLAADRYAVSAFLGYLLLLIGIGVYSSRFSSEGISEFFIGGRKINRFVIALSAVVSGRSAWLLLGVTGMAYSQGASAVWAVMGYIIVELFLFLYYARRLRIFSESYNCITLTDMFQAIFMIFALVVLPLIAIADAGGLSSVLSQLTEMEMSLADPLALTFGGVIGFLGIGLGSPGNPHILTRYMAIDDVEQLKWSAIVGTVWNVLMGWGALFIGLAGRVYFPEVDLLPASDTENLYPALAREHLHPAVFGLVVASIFAAIMSTADSQLLVAASAVVRDVYDRIIKKDTDIAQETLVLYSRTIIVVLVGIALISSLVAQELVFWLVLFAWAGLGASLGPTSILALYWRGTTKAGVIAGLLTGTTVTIIWYYIPVLKDNLYELIPAFLLSLLVTWLVSCYTQKPEHIEEAFIELEK